MSGTNARTTAYESDFAVSKADRIVGKDEDGPYRARLELKSSVPPSSALKDSTVSNLNPLGTRACVVDATYYA